MVVNEMLAALHRERENLDNAINSLEQLERGIDPNRLGSGTNLKKRGRPRGSKNKIKDTILTLVAHG